MSYDTLHLTEMTRAYDKSKDKKGVKRVVNATNAAHDIDRQIIRMMLSLPDLVCYRGKWNVFTFILLKLSNYL
jgi:hypothetical protein